MRLVQVRKQKFHNQQIFNNFTGYDLDYKNPKTFNEKINWLKFNYRDPLITQCSGKDTMRNYIIDTLGVEGEQYLTDLVGKGVYTSVSDIRNRDLPVSFVLKLNNGSGKNIICSNKTDFDLSSAKSEIENWLKPEHNHYYNFYEWGYKNVKSTIVCERYLGDWGEVRDYKLFCFNGEPKFIYVSDEFDDHKAHIDMDYLTLDWKRTGYVRKTYKPPKTLFKKPSSLGEMIDVARKLAEPFPFVRVDFFEVKGKPKVVEMTFYPGGGYGAFEEIKHDIEIGDMLQLPKKKRPARFLTRGYYGYGNI